MTKHEKIVRAALDNEAGRTLLAYLYEQYTPTGISPDANIMYYKTGQSHVIRDLIEAVYGKDLRVQHHEINQRLSAIDNILENE